MNAKRPAEARREETPGGRLSKRSHSRRQTPALEFADRLELRERLAAIVDELRLLDADDRDVPLTLAEGLLEDVERELGASADRREP